MKLPSPLLLFFLACCIALKASARPNVLLITADDLGWDSLGCTGNPLKGLSPNLDRLASEGLLIQHCHIATPICGPSRHALYTGQYPQSSGYLGHGVQPPKWWKAQDHDVVRKSITSRLHDAGYLTGCVGKHGSDWCKFSVPPFGANQQTGMGRNPEKYYQFVRDFLQRSKAEDKPFYLTANTHDPHRYWARHRSETKQWIDANMGSKDWKALPNGKPYPDPAIDFCPEACPMPPQYPEDPRLREDLSKYYGSVHRMDQVVGKVLQALDESGLAQETLVLFLSDHGMAWEMAKWSLYPAGTRTPLILRWPGKLEPGQTNECSVLSVVDIAPTLADLCGLTPMQSVDGQSFRCLLEGKPNEWERTHAFTTFNYMNNLPPANEAVEAYSRDLYLQQEQYRPSRALSSNQYTYIWNGWADGKTPLPRTMGGEVAWLLRDGNEHREWIHFAQHRTTEELYDTVQDPGCRHNLAKSPEYDKALKRMRSQLLDTLVKTKDHELPNFRHTHKR